MSGYKHHQRPRCRDDVLPAFQQLGKYSFNVRKNVAMNEFSYCL